METKQQDEYIAKAFEWMGYAHSFIVPPIGLSGGLALFWKKEVDVEILESAANFIDTQIKYKNSQAHITFIYGAPQVENRSVFWDRITLLGVGRSSAWLLTGDFNDILDNSEKKGGPLRWEGSFLAFRSFVSQNGLWDLNHSGNSLSWRGTRYSHHIKSRLDRALANCAWSEKYPTSRCEYLRFEGSDHRPLMTFLGSKQKRKNKLFRFDRNLKEKEEIRDLVRDSWELYRQDSVLHKISRCRQSIIQWTKDQNANSAKLILSSQRLLKATLSSEVPDQERINSLTLELESAYRLEELFWKQRSRVQWLHSGDRNTGYFHAITRTRRQPNHLSVIEDSQGQAFHEEEEIAATISEYFQGIFTSNNTCDLKVIDEVLLPSISPQCNEALSKIPSSKEITEALYSINADKAPRPNGFSAAFYHAYWDIIGEDVSRDIRLFFLTSCLSPRINETHVTLIPKIFAPRRVSDYRPIALCSVHYKIIAKLLTRRLQPWLTSLISKHQSAFVPGRAIADNVLITHEILHFLRVSGAKKYCSMAIKTDMSKAYDRIEWNFLKTVLEKLGFSTTWISWVMQCVCSVSYSFLINGSPQGSVIPSRGLRQGDPLSPYLFILCTEVLSGLCRKAQENGSLVGIRVARGSPQVNHLLFADDTMFFCKTNPTCCGALSRILKQYEVASGQCINLAKSAITFSSKTPQEIKRRVKDSLLIENEGGIGKYLGLPEHFGRRKRDIFSSMVDRMRQRSHSWCTKFLSGAGKQILLKAVLSSMPSYAMSCFKLPVSLCKQIQSVLTRF